MTSTSPNIYHIPQKVIEKSTLAITLSTFVDELNVATVRKTLTWGLFDPNGNVINSHGAESLTVTDPVSILLKGDDLALGEATTNNKRYVLIQGTYDSDLGTDNPLIVQVDFEIQNVVGLS